MCSVFVRSIFKTLNLTCFPCLGFNFHLGLIFATSQDFSHNSWEDVSNDTYSCPDYPYCELGQIVKGFIVTVPDLKKHKLIF